MRLGYPVGVAGVTLAAVLLTASCTDRTELRRASDEPTSGGHQASTGHPAATSDQAPDTASHVSRVPRPTPRTLLTDREVAPEGVRPVQAGQQVRAVEGRLPDCLRGGLRTAEPASGKLAAAWRYPTGSVLAQYVAGYPAPVLDRLLRQVADCGRSLPTPPAATTEQVRWCEPNLAGTVSCSVLLAGGQRASLVTVRSSRSDRAAQAVTRLAPLAASKLAD